MNRNQLLYNASMALVQCAKYISPVDENFVQLMLDKAQEYKDKIIVDENVEKEINEFEQEIRKGL